MVLTTLLQAIQRAVWGPLPRAPAEAEAKGLVLVVDGVGGLDLCGRGLSHVVARAGRGLEVRIFRWSHGFGRWHADLTDVRHHRDRSQALADEIRAYRERWPDRRICVVAKSGGCGLAVWAMERLGRDAVDTVVLLAPALSPGYDLGPALRAVRDEMVVFWSPYDLFVLGIGTVVFKSVDRVRCRASGMRGFGVPADEVARGKLRQVRWGARMMRCGYFGGHVGPDNPIFLRKYVLPLLDRSGGSESCGEAGRESSPAAGGPIT